MNDIPIGLSVICVLYGAGVLTWCWLRAVRSSPDTTRRPERWAVALAAMASVTMIFGGIGLAPWLSSGGLAMMFLLAGLAMLFLSSPRLAPEPTRAPQDWLDD